MRESLTRIICLSFCGIWLCSHSQADRPASDDLCTVIGQPVTLAGELSMRGKIGPFVMVAGRPVYLISGGHFEWAREYFQMEGKQVRVTGTLRFYKAPPTLKGPDYVAQLPDFYYLEAENAKIAPARPGGTVRQ